MSMIENLEYRWDAVRDYKSAARIPQKSAQAALNVLRHVGFVRQTEKIGNRLLYESTGCTDQDTPPILIPL